jgi:acyl-homoserine lactone acylase PvdQ
VERRAAAQLCAWDGRMEAASVGASIYELTAHALADALFAAMLRRRRRRGGGQHARNDGDGDDAELLALATGMGIDPNLKAKSELKNGVIGNVLQAVTQPEEWGLTSADAFLVDGLQQACTWLQDKLGDSVPQWEWGRLHQCHFNNSGANTLGDFLNVPAFPYGGNSDTCAQVSISGIPGETVPSQEPPGTASYRVVYNPHDWDASKNIAPVGQSENYLSTHYSDQTEYWRRGELKPMPWSRTAVEAATTSRLAASPLGARL